MNAIPSRRGRVAVVGAGPAGMATALSVHQAGHDVILLERVMRDAILDHTPLLQKVVGESSPGEIMAQLAAIDQAEAGFKALRAATETQPGAGQLANARISP